MPDSGALGCEGRKRVVRCAHLRRSNGLSPCVHSGLPRHSSSQARLTHLELLAAGDVNVEQVHLAVLGDHLAFRVVRRERVVDVVRAVFLLRDGSCFVSLPRAEQLDVPPMSQTPLSRAISLRAVMLSPSSPLAGSSLPFLTLGTRSLYCSKAVTA